MAIPICSGVLGESLTAEGRQYVSRAEKYHHLFLAKLKLLKTCHQTTLRTSAHIFKHAVSMFSMYTAHWAIRTTEFIIPTHLWLHNCHSPAHNINKILCHTLTQTWAHYASSFINSVIQHNTQLRWYLTNGGEKKAKNTTTQTSHKSPVNTTTYRSRPCKVNTLCYTLSHLIAEQANTNTLKVFWCDLQIRKHNKRTRLYETYTFCQTSLCVREIFWRLEITHLRLISARAKYALKLLFCSEIKRTVTSLHWGVS